MEFIKDSDPKRLKKFLGARLKDMKLQAVLERVELLPFKIASAGEITEEANPNDPEWSEAGRYHALPPDGNSVWMKRTTVLPELGKDEFFALNLSFGKVTEGLLYVNGVIQGSFPANMVKDAGMVPLKGYSGGEALDFMIHLYPGEPWGDLAEFPPQTLERFELLRISKTNLNLYDAFSAAYEAALTMDSCSPYYRIIMKALESGYNKLDFTSTRSYINSANEVINLLEREIFNGRDLQPVSIGVFGHAHIDVAWLWTVSVTAGKSIRTFAGQLQLLDFYKNWKFQQGQPKLYELVKEKTPILFEGIKKKVKENRWCAEGAAWVEFDANITGGESIIRHLIYGKEFFKKEFAVKNTVAWLPDVFGFSGSLPQIFKKSGIDLLITTKISWNESTRFPYDTFRWQGIDGTQLTTHFITSPAGEVHTYNTNLTSEEISGTWKEYLQKDVNSDLIMPFGYGDGGGGPKDFMVRKLSWFKKGITGFFNVYDESLEGFKKKLFEKDSSNFPLWIGELYLETHRGCLTTQAFCKKQNRRLEFLLERAEIISTISGKKKSFSDRLKKLWKILLLNQFHDIITGSSIKKVYRETSEQYARIEDGCRKVMAEALIPYINPGKMAVTIFNPFSWEYTGYARLPGGLKPVGEFSEFENGSALLKIEKLKPLGFRTIPVSKRNNVNEPNSYPNAKNHLLENDFCRLNIDTAQGSITSLQLKPGKREYCFDDTGINLFRLYEDKPIKPGMGAWNLEYIHQFKEYKDGISLIENANFSKGKTFQKVSMKHKLSKSIIRQDIFILEDDPLVYFRTKVCWQENEAVLKVSFPVNINACAAAYDVQFGNIERPSHRNTPADHAHFEVPGHKWVDVSEGHKGLALITDSKYGYSVNGSCISATLLRSPNSPDNTADRGTHEFTYALYPHAGSWRQSEVPVHAYQLNYPVMIFQGELRKPYKSEMQKGLVKITDTSGDGINKGNNIILETIKHAERGKSIIVRLYECKNSRGRFRINLNLPAGEIKKASRCNLLEEVEQNLEFNGKSGVEISYKPYEIITLKLQIK